MIRMILNDKKIKALIKKIQKESGTASSLVRKREYSEDEIPKEHDSSKELFDEMKKKPHS